MPTGNTNMDDIFIYSSDEDESLMIQNELNKHHNKLKLIKKYNKKYKKNNKKDSKDTIPNESFQSDVNP